VPPCARDFRGDVQPETQSLAIAGAIELISQERVGRTVRERLALAARLSERITALSVYVEYELAENEAKRVPEELPMSTHLPGFGVRRK